MKRPQFWYWTSYLVPVCRINLVKCHETFRPAVTLKNGRLQLLNVQVVREVVFNESDNFIYSKHALSAPFFSIIERNVLMALVSFYKDMLGKETTHRTQQFLAFFVTQNPVKCRACAVARKIETDCFCRKLSISNDPVVRISRHLAKQ